MSVIVSLDLPSAARTGRASNAVSFSRPRRPSTVRRAMVLNALLISLTSNRLSPPSDGDALNVRESVPSRVQEISTWAWQSGCLVLFSSSSEIEDTSCSSWASDKVKAGRSAENTAVDLSAGGGGGGGGAARAAV